MPAETAKLLVEKGLRPERPGPRLRSAILSRLETLAKEGHDREEALQELYPNTLLDGPILESVTAALVSGANLLLLGPPGSGKTSLAKDVWNLYPKEVLVVDGCPVQDDPLSLISPDFAREVPPCPHCKATYGSVSLREVGDFDAGRVDPGSVPVRRTRLREGYGLARLQGSPEVFPDYLTGAINIAKLEEIGDPESPLVLEPGKLMQANRGLLLIDEVGKLPRGTQNVLLQALQESIVTPSKSRETFPASFIAITTSNVDDLDTINDPLLGRLTSVYVGFNEDHHKNRQIVDRALSGGTRAYVAGPVREAAVVTIERWRRTAEGVPDLAEVGSNRTMIDSLRRAEALALLASRDAVTFEDFERGVREAMGGRVRGRSGEGFFQNRNAVEAFLKKNGKELLSQAAEGYWCDFFAVALKEDKAEAERVIRETREVVRDPRKLQAALDGQGAPYAKFRRWADYVDSREGKSGAERGKRVAHTFGLLESVKAFDAAGK